GKTVRYALASSGEAGIAGMEPGQAGPLREDEQRRAAAIVGVSHVDFWGFPDSNIRNTPELRAKIAAVIGELRPDVVVAIYGGAEFGPGMPNQRDHIEFAAAVTDAWDTLADKPRWLFQGGPGPTHVEDVEAYLDVATESLAAHDVYLSVLDPATPVREQARRVVDMTTSAQPGRRVAGFRLQRSTIS
ncbi:MAG: PIG-L family deacetylase, partial [Mycobacterium sp.]